MSVLRHAAFGCGLAVASSLLLARIHPFGNASLYTPRPTEAPLLEHAAFPPEVRATLIAQCADCHSTQTRVPFYGRLAPASWLMEHDIVEARGAMNFSLWERYSPEQQQTFEALMAKKTKAGDMPPMQYRLVHSGGSRFDLRDLTEWKRKNPVPTEGATVQGLGNGDSDRGKRVFEKRCTGCHSMKRDGEGPRLEGVYGWTSGTVPGFGYSSALKAAHLVWDDHTLDRWLTDPDTLVPGNDMQVRLSKPQERRDLIQFLKQNPGK